MLKNYIGKSKYGELVTQRVDESGIRGFNEYSVYELHDGTVVATITGLVHHVILDTGKEYSTNDKAAPVIECDVEFEYECDTTTCEECGAMHDSDDHGRSWTIVGECEAVCMGCRKAENVLVKLDKADKLFKAQNIADINLDEYDEVETLFCDLSGMGGEGERALTKKQAIQAAAELIKQYEGPLYVGITDIGQFQVYVTVFRKPWRMNMTKRQVWDQLFKLLNFKQYTIVADSYGRATDGLPNLSYDTYFKRTLKVTKSKKLVTLAKCGLKAPLVTPTDNEYEVITFGQGYQLR